MATTPNEYTLKGKLQIVLEGCDGAIELGDVEIPVRLDFRKPPRPGQAYRGAHPGSVLPCAEDDDSGRVGS